MNKIVKTSLLQPDAPFPLVISPIGTGTPEALCQALTECRSDLAAALQKHGALLFRGFDVTNSEAFEQACTTFDSDLREDYIGTGVRKALTKHTFTASELPPHFPLPQHTELSYLRTQMPRTLFFCCLREPLSGGETPLADMAAVVRQLDPQLMQRFRDRGILYYRNFPTPDSKPADPWSLKGWPETFGTRDKAQVESVCRPDNVSVRWGRGDSLQLTHTLPATAKHPVTGTEFWNNHTVLWHSSSAYGEYKRIFQRTHKLKHLLMFLILLLITFVRRLFRNETLLGKNCFYGDGTRIKDSEMEQVRAAVWRNMVTFKWQRGDVLIVDNFRLSHGRLPFTGPRLVSVAMTGPYPKQVWTTA